MQRVEVISIQSTRKMFDKIKSNQQKEDWAVCLETVFEVLLYFYWHIILGLADIGAAPSAMSSFIIAAD